MLPILKNQEGPEVIIGNNLSSHINMEVLRLCNENNKVFSTSIECYSSPTATGCGLLLPDESCLAKDVERLEGDGRWKSVHICTQGPISNFKNLWDSLIKGPENLISGFHKSGIYPTDRQSVLKRLPSGSFYSSISSLVRESFLEQIVKKREEVT